MNKTLILIDGHALAFRMFYALERTGMKTTDKQPTWAVYGFFKAVFDLLLKIKPDFIAVAFDVGRQTFRVEKYEQYKRLYDAKIEFINVEAIEASSSEIRGSIDSQKAKELLPKAVFDFIIEKGLYR